MRIFLHGNMQRLSSFSIVNHHLLRELRRRGHDVVPFPSDGAEAGPVNPAPPDVHIFHGHLPDARSAPGRLNVFLMAYEYLSPTRELRALAARLNAAFDVVLVTADFIVPVVRKAGLRLPVEVLRLGVDPEEFHPRVPPARLPTGKAFVFLYVGAANERKGLDVLLRAYRSEFSDADDTVLVIKEAMRDPTFEPWVAKLRRRYLEDRPLARRRGPGPAEVFWVQEESASVAGYFTRANVGVFPHRGEGFGLATLECIASGRRVIATAGTGPATFCSRGNSWPIRARRVRRHGRIELEPDGRHLRTLLRAAHRRGAATVTETEEISRTVAEWTWPRSVAALDAIIRRHLGRRDARAAVSTGGRLRRTRPPVVAYSFFARGDTSWKKVCSEIDRSLAGRFEGYRPLTHHDRFDLREVDILVGQSEHCLEVLLKARRLNPGLVTVLHQECTVLADRLAIVNDERARCGLPPRVTTPMDLWRNRTENELADRFIVASSVARGFFLRSGFPPERIDVIPHGIRLGPLHVRSRASRMRFLFVGTDPFCKGIRLLLAAWERARLRRAELVCVADREIMASTLLLAHLVRTPSVTVLPLTSYRRFREHYLETDCQVLPSLADTFSVAVGDGMGLGKPAIVSTATGIADLITHGVNGHVVPAGDVERLAESLREFADDQGRVRRMGEAAWETAREHPWARVRRRVADVVASLWRG